jgi:hypothetical protein
VGYKLVIKMFKDGNLHTDTTPNTAAGGVLPSYPLEIQNADGGSFGNAAGTFLNNMTLAYFSAPQPETLASPQRLRLPAGDQAAIKGSGWER